MDRVALTTHLAAQYGALFAEAGIPVTDTADGIDVVLNAVERVYADHAGLADSWAAPLAEFYALERILVGLAVNFDVTVDGDSFRLSQMFEQVRKLLEMRRKTVGWLIGDGDGAGAVVDATPFTFTKPFLTGEGREWA